MERIEFKTFTKMSKNSIVDYKDLIHYAKELGQEAIVFTDHNSIEIFPEIDRYIQKENLKDFKVMYGTVVDMLENDFIIPVTVIVRNQKGLKNLYKIMSRMKVDHLEEYDRQFLFRDDLVELEDGLLYGLDVLTMKDIYENQTDQQIGEDMMWYDFIEVKPFIGCEEYIKRIVQIASYYRKIVIATGNVCYVKLKEKKDYEILFPEQSKNEDKYLKSTKEMTDQFRFLHDDHKILDIVVNNTHKLADLVDDIQIHLHKLYLPKIENGKDLLLDMVYGKAYEMYGNPLPEFIQKRLNEELYGKDSNHNGIIHLQYESIFLINQKLVEYSHRLGYPVCPRGNVSSSLVAYFMGITDINPLPPHYYCSKCKNILLIDQDGCGFDLPDKECPICHKMMEKDGFHLSYHALLGEDVNKVPNISINYSINIKDELNQYLIQMFGEDKVYKAGVVGMKQESEVRKWIDHLSTRNHLKLTEERKEKLVAKLNGAIKVIGQHPGATFVIPQGKSIYDFTPIAYACDNKKYHKVTYFDYHDLNKTLLEIHMLYHDSVSMLKELEDITGVPSHKVKFNDPKIIEFICHGNTEHILEFDHEVEKAMIQKEKPTHINEFIHIVIKAHSNEEYTLSKAHAASYVVLAFKLAWYKVYYPQEFKKVSMKYE